MIPPINEEDSEKSTIDEWMLMRSKALHLERRPPAFDNISSQKTDRLLGSASTNPPESPSRQRLVRFDLQSTEVIHHKAKPLSSQEIDSAWYSEQDISDFRRNMRHELKELRLHSTEHDGMEAIQFLTHVHYVFSCMDYVCHDYKEILGPVSLERLARVSETNGCRTGLESRFAMLLKQDGNDRRNAQQDTVYEIQMDYYNGNFASEEEMRQELVECCRANSQVSVLLAQVIAQLQYLNVVFDDEQTWSRQLGLVPLQ